MLDLEAMRAAVAAVLDKCGIPEERRWCYLAGRPPFLTVAHWPPAFDDGWHLYVGLEGDRAIFHGTMTATCRDVLSAIWPLFVGEQDQVVAAERARWAGLVAAVEAALRRYDREDTGHGFVRGEVAWAMAGDLRLALDAAKEQP